jgi:hypothetical protein
MTQLKLALFQKIVIFLDQTYLKVGLDSVLVREWVGTVFDRVSSRGSVDTIAWIKGIRLCCTRYLAGHPLKEVPGFGDKLDDDGLPKLAIAELIRERDPPKVRLGLTLLNVSRILPGWKKPDLTTITDAGKPFDDQFGLELSAVVRSLGWKLPPILWDGWHTTTKAGPNAQALLGSIEDISLLTDSQISDLGILGGESIIQAIETLRLFSARDWSAKFGLSLKGRRSKLAKINDKESKCRIVGILDYPSQSALYPLHKALMRLLKGLKSDCTFNQGSFRATLPSKGPYHSIDLSAATDRFPVSLQERVLAELISKEYAAAWRRTVVEDRNFTVPWTRPETSVKYSVGQPMGAYSSWALFAVTHHAFVRLAAKRAGMGVRFSSYALLGDDIVIANDAVAKEYVQMLGEVGVGISELKTHVSDDTYEFAKRWIHRGSEVSPAPLGSLFEAMRLVRDWNGGFSHPEKGVRFISYYEVATWFREVEARWVPRSYTMVTRDLIALLLKLLLPKTGYASRLADKSFRFFLLPSRDDRRNLRLYKSAMLARILAGNIFTCNLSSQPKFLHERLMIWLNECKARVLENAIKNQLASLSKFQLELGKYVDLIPKELGVQSALLLVPPLAVVRQNIAELQIEFDKAHKVRESSDIQQWLDLDVRLFLDPFATLSTRASKTVASNKASILNHVSAMLRGIEKMRDLAVTDIDLMSLIHVIDNHVVLPKAGRAKPKVKRPVQERKEPYRIKSVAERCVLP